MAAELYKTDLWKVEMNDDGMLSFSNMLDKFVGIDPNAPTIINWYNVDSGMPQLAEFNFQVNILALFSPNLCEILESLEMATSIRNTSF